MQHYFNVFKNFAHFNGRSSRAEYWYFTLFYVLTIFVLAFIDVSFKITPDENKSILVSIYQVITLLPYLSLGFRRMQDVGKSKWFYLVPVYNFILTLQKGDQGDNKYGKDPYAAK